MNVDVVLDSIEPMGEGAFMNSGILSVEINSSNLISLNNRRSIMMGIFSGCTSLKSFKVSNSSTLKSIDVESFKRCTSLTDVVLSDKITSIGESAFNGCSSLQNINIPNGVSVIDEETFEDCESLKTLHLPDGVMKIDDNAFNGCSSLEQLNTPENLMVIGQKAFYKCKKLLQFDIPAGIVSIGHNAFRVVAVSRQFCFLLNWTGPDWNKMSLTAAKTWRR